VDVFWKRWSASSKGKLRASQGGVAPGEPERAGRDGRKQAPGNLNINHEPGNGTNASSARAGGSCSVPPAWSRHRETLQDLSQLGDSPHPQPGGANKSSPHPWSSLESPGWGCSVRLASPRSQRQRLSPAWHRAQRCNPRASRSLPGPRQPRLQDQAPTCPNPCARCAGRAGGRSSAGGGGWRGVSPPGGGPAPCPTASAPHASPAAPCPLASSPAINSPRLRDGITDIYRVLQQPAPLPRGAVGRGHHAASRPCRGFQPAAGGERS